jgi:competence protein CoiA
MQFALVNQVRSHAQKGLEGVCELCNSKVIAKCGSIVVHHWSHYSRKECDKWWEPETLWHRNWKNKFPEEYREIIFKNDSTMEIHRADIYTPAGLTIEFQHSFISNEERISRENFYNKLIWVVDGSRRANDYKRFQKKSHYLTTFYKDKKDIFQVSNIEDLLPSYWTDCPVPVIFDFMTITNNIEFCSSKGFLYCLFPQRVGRNAILAKISSVSFVKSIVEGEWDKNYSVFLDELKKDDLEIREREETIRLKLKLSENKLLKIPNKRHWRF